ncbi:MAG: metallophosphoesterase family protein [Planctomycetaceae bacterium]
MRKLAAGIIAIGLVGLIAAVASHRAPGNARTDDLSPLSIRVEDRNPWTSLTLNNQPRNFQFAVVSDRTGGVRPGVFAQAVRKLNLLQPEFVISVGDLITGYSEDSAQWAIEWSEFQAKVQQLQMPFFYVPGNHDLSNAGMDANWKRKFGRTYYDFLYHDTLFVVLNSEDPPGDKGCRFSAGQLRWLTEVLARNQNVRWTFVFFHKPAWTTPEGAHPDFDLEGSGFSAIERALAGRKYTVFAGHWHKYARFERNGSDWIMLATTGGASPLRGKSVGEFDHVVWITMKGSEPIIANLLLDGIEDKGVRTLPNPTPVAAKLAE